MFAIKVNNCQFLGEFFIKEENAKERVETLNAAVNKEFEQLSKIDVNVKFRFYSYVKISPMDD